MIRLMDARSAAGRRDALEFVRRHHLAHAEQLADALRAVREIIADVRARGDAALLDHTVRLDGPRLSPDQLRVPATALDAARRALAHDLRNAVQAAAANVRAYQTALLPRPACVTRAGVRLESRVQPLARVGCLVPGAAAPLISTIIMTVVPAHVAGVPEICIVAPPRHAGDVHPAILGVAAELGVSEVYRVGGAQAVAALALGTATIRAVDKIVGPGNIYTQLAKRELFGVVGIDSVAGASELMIIADESAAPRCVAADLLAQAEHDPGIAILLAFDAQTVTAVSAEIDSLLAALPRAAGARRSLDQFGAAIVVADNSAAAELANAMAPEHLHVQTRDAEALANLCHHAGAIFVGPHSPEALGDYVAGPSHVLPTGGTARFSSGLTVADFTRRVSVVGFGSDAIRREGPDAITLADAEGLTAHAESVRRRVDEGRPTLGSE
ncbi:MAG: Histidinol dehydrogenase [Phycisphaerae bacterium]|nr:Histidinol dehydrogenase [Phycisphaerae bacterium]